MEDGGLRDSGHSAFVLKSKQGDAHFILARLIKNTEALPDKEGIKDYLQAMRSKTEAWFDTISKLGFESEDTTFKTDWISNPERALYALRQTQHHLGQLSHEFQSNGFGELEWK